LSGTGDRADRSHFQFSIESPIGQIEKLNRAVDGDFPMVARFLVGELVIR
jgi:hypothetical protein